ncbi:mannitol dehydrogenase family protein [Kribbella sp. NBC_01505]|uniref:mannitol dehydrogenase family protein n=1 Tax=Kribbella sp. NBC_01505 TaxID=2903580 RepID=UPI0038665C02
MNRLSLAHLPVAPAVDPMSLSIGVVHLGLGAFHRAHQAVITERAAALTGDTRWGISGVSQRSATVREQLEPQDGLYAVLERGNGDPTIQVVGSIREVLTAPEAPEAVVARMADSAVSVVTLTVTEKGYRAKSGGLDLDDPEIQADLTGRPPRTVVGQLAAALARRDSPLTIVSCDNLVANGPFLRRLVAEYFEALGKVPEVFEASRFPASMVDRIVPATTEADRDEAARLLGVRDEAVVVAEPFLQWVIEDDFAGPRPAWEQGGAVLTADVAPWEQAKLRILNATHSMLAYLGALRGYETIAEAVRDKELAAFAHTLITDDVIPTLTPPDGLNLASYGGTVLDRFANPALKHRTAQVAMDGSVKLPVRLLGTVEDRLTVGAEPRTLALAVAAWMVYVNTAANLDDPQAALLTAALDGADTPAAIVDSLLAIDAIFTPSLQNSAPFRDLLVEQVTALRRR